MRKFMVISLMALFLWVSGCAVHVCNTSEDWVLAKGSDGSEEAVGPCEYRQLTTITPGNSMNVAICYERGNELGGTAQYLGPACVHRIAHGGGPVSVGYERSTVCRLMSTWLTYNSRPAWLAWGMSYRLTTVRPACANRSRAAGWGRTT